MSALETKSLLCVWLNRNIICRDGGRGVDDRVFSNYFNNKIFWYLL